MKNTIKEILCGKNSTVSGLMALSIVLLIGLGCFCNKEKFEELGKSNTGNTSTTPIASTPVPEATKTYTKADASKAEIPSQDEMQDMVKKTMLDFNDALQKEDFGDFHSSVAKIWQKQVTPAQMKENFNAFIEGEADMSDIRPLKADFTNPGEITRSTGVKTLETRGEYDTTPNKTTFYLKYIPEGKDWKLAYINVYTNVKQRRY